MQKHDKESTKQQLFQLNEALQRGAYKNVRSILNEELQPVEIALLLESSPPKERRTLWELIVRHFGDFRAHAQVAQYHIQLDIRAHHY